MNSNDGVPVYSREPSPRAAVRAPPAAPVWVAVLLRPAVLLAVFYAIAICFERFIEVEVYKPYRIIGGALVLCALANGRLVVDGVARAVIMFLAIGLGLGMFNTLLSGTDTDGMSSDAMLWVFNIVVYIAICSLMRHRREIAVILVVHAVAMTFASFDILGQSQQALIDEGASTRMSGDFKNPAHACLSMMMASLIIVSLMRRALDPSSHLLRRMVIVAVAVSLIVFQLYVSSLTGSRAGAVVFVIGVLVYLAVIGRMRVAVGIGVAAISLGLLLTQLDAWPEESSNNILVERVESKGLDIDRLYLWRSGLDAYLDSYSLGLGLAQYRTVHREYFETYASRGDPRMLNHDLSLHSDFISALVEFGFFGFLVFIALCRRIWGAAKAIANPDVRALALALAVATAVMALSHAMLPYFGLWFYLALMTSWQRVEAAERLRLAGGA